MRFSGKTRWRGIGWRGLAAACRLACKRLAPTSASKRPLCTWPVCLGGARERTPLMCMWCTNRQLKTICTQNREQARELFAQHPHLGPPPPLPPPPYFPCDGATMCVHGGDPPSIQGGAIMSKVRHDSAAGGSRGEASGAGRQAGRGGGCPAPGLA